MDFRTGTTNLRLAQQRAKAHLQKLAEDPIITRKGGGTVEAVAALYLKTPKRTKENVAKDNVSRLRTICRVALGKKLEEVTCREIGPSLWQQYQKAALEERKLKFDLVTRYRENIAINSAVRAARCLFLAPLIRVYRQDGLDVQMNAGEAVMMPEPHVAPVKVDDKPLVEGWAKLHGDPEKLMLWLVVGIARFAGLRREEIAALRVGWIEEKKGAVRIMLCDRPEEKWWTKTGKPYSAQVVNAQLSEYLSGLLKTQSADTFVVGEPGSGNDRADWFESVPQAWLREHGVNADKPLHRLRGLYADHVAEITADAVAIRLAAERAAQEALGHTSPETTKKHYLTPRD